MFFWAYLYSASTQHRNLPSAEWPILFCGPTQEPCVSHSQHRKNRERFGKNQVNGPEGQKKARNKSLAVSVAWMAIHWPTPGFKGITFKLCALTIWDFTGGGGRALRQHYNLSSTGSSVIIINRLEGKIPSTFRIRWEKFYRLLRLWYARLLNILTAGFPRGKRWKLPVETMQCPDTPELSR